MTFYGFALRRPVGVPSMISIAVMGAQILLIWSAILFLYGTFFIMFSRPQGIFGEGGPQLTHYVAALSGVGGMIGSVLIMIAGELAGAIFCIEANTRQTKETLLIACKTS